MNKKLLITSTIFMAFIMTFSPYSTVLAQDPFVGGTLTVPMGSDALTLNPFTWGSTYESYIIGHIYDALVQNDINNQPTPVLCTGWTHNETLEKWIFTLREDVYWSDGEPLDIYDVNYTWYLLWTDPAIPRRSWLFDEIFDITVLSDTQIQVEFWWGPKPADVLYDFATTWIVPQHIWEDITDIYTFANEEPVGCGPFVLEEWSHGSFFRFSRNDQYYLDGPWVETKIVQIIREIEAGYYALSVGDIELLGAVPPELENVAKSDPNIEIHEYLNDYIMYLGLNQRRYPNDEVNFRKAVLHGINRSEIMEIAGYGRGLVAPASMSLPYGAYYNPDIEQYAYDVALANQLLDDLGFLDTDNDKVREDGLGDPLKFNLGVSAEYQESVDTARMIQNYMLALNISITVQPVIWDILWSTVGGPGGSYAGKYDYDWAFLGWTGFWSDFHPSWAYWMFSANRWWGSDNVNIPGWNSSVRWEVTTLVDEVLYETDEAIVRQKLDEAQVLIAEDLPYLPIRITGGVTLYRTDKFTGWIMGNTTGPDNWQSWMAVHLIEPDEGAPGFEIMTAVLAVGFILGITYFRKRRK
ncbi:hypothetical protein ES705_05572 [subsurface metagenome]